MIALAEKSSQAVMKDAGTNFAELHEKAKKGDEAFQGDDAIAWKRGWATLHTVLAKDAYADAINSKLAKWKTTSADEEQLGWAMWEVAQELRKQP